MFGLLKRTLSPQAVAAPPPVPSLSSIAVMDVPPPAPGPSGEALPCEQAFSSNVTYTATALDLDFFDAVAAASGKPARHISLESLQARRQGYLGTALPLFDLIDPFHDHGRLGPAGTAIAALDRMRKLNQTKPTSEVPALAYIQGHGVLLGVVTATSVPFPFTVTFSSIGAGREGSADAAKAAWMSVSGAFLFSMYCTLPGYIPPAYRTKILEARDLAKAVGGDVRLIVEANWKLAGTAVGKPDKADPLIVIVKGQNIAYLDRFDCTAKEAHLAQEHAVKVPPRS